MLLFSQYGERVQARVTSFYGIGVVTRDIQDPLTGDLSGAEIHLDHLLGAEERLFLLGHLFGHTVQWNVHPGAFEIGRLRRIFLPVLTGSDCASTIYLFWPCLM